MFTDMVGFTSAAQRHEAVALDLLREQEGLVRPIVLAHGGREVKSTGDGSLIEFSSGLQAAECGVEVLTRLHERNRAREVEPIRLRIGLHIGEVESRDADIFGDAVNIAARVLSVAEPEGIALTEEVAHLLENKVAYPVEGLGARGLKGVDRPIPVYRIVLPWSSPIVLVQTRVYPRLAILPLRNISPDPSDAYFADGLTEELISVLGQMRELRVISRSAVSRYGSQDRPLAAIGRELGASAVLEGSVRKAGDRLRISLHLVDVATEEGLWSQTFDRKLNDIFAVQAEVGERTAASLRVRLLGSERAALSRPPTENLAAYGLYLQALHEMRGRAPGSNARAIELLRQAIEADPRFAVAYAMLAHRLLGGIGEDRSAREVADEARRLVEKALQLDPLAPEVHSARANLAMQIELNWATAEAEFRRALELNPSDPGARSWYSLLLRTLQRYPEALEHLRTVVELDPLDPGPRAFIASILRLMGDAAGAEEYVRTQLRPTMSSREYQETLAYTLAYSGRNAEALRELDAAPAPEGSSPSMDAVVFRARFGEPAGARALLEELTKRAATKYVTLSELAILAAACGDADRAIAYLEQDWTEGDRGLWFYYQGLGFDGIRSDPRFVKMLERYRLPVSAPFLRTRTVL